jgi:hypothetical protein
MPLDDDDVVVQKAKKIAEAAEVVGKKDTKIWVAVAAFILGLIAGAWLF